MTMRPCFFWLIMLLPLIRSVSLSEIDSTATTVKRSDIGHWIAFRAGGIVSGAELENSWSIVAGYEGRFTEVWSVPIELQWYQDNRPTHLLVSVALKLRIPFDRTATNIYVQGGFGTGVLSYSSHWAIGFEYGLIDRLSFSIQAKKYQIIDDAFMTAGVNLSLTSDHSGTD